jgi:hypothetical protein
MLPISPVVLVPSRARKVLPEQQGHLNGWGLMPAASRPSADGSGEVVALRDGHY